MEKKVHQVMEQIHRLPDLERLADVGFEEKLKNWHSLGALDEDEILRRMEMHLDELPSVRYTWVRIAAKQMGVGGDDSWGAPVHEEYRIHADQPMKLEFVIMPLRS